MADSVVSFDTSCHAFANGHGKLGANLFIPDPVNRQVDDIFGANNKVSVDVRYPKTVLPGDTFTYSIGLRTLDIHTEFDPHSDEHPITNAQRIKVDIAIPEGTEFVSAAVGKNLQGDTTPTGSSQPTSIIRIDDQGNEDPEGKFLRMAVDNKTERRTVNGVQSFNGPNANGNAAGGFTAGKTNVGTDPQIVFPSFQVTVKAANAPGTTIPLKLRAGSPANEYKNPRNFLTFLSQNDDAGNFLEPDTHGFVSIRCAPRDTPTSAVNAGAEALASVSTLISPGTVSSCEGKSGVELDQCTIDQEVVNEEYGGSVVGSKPAKSFSDGVYKVQTDIVNGVYTHSEGDGVWSVAARADDGSLFVRQHGSCTDFGGKMTIFSTDVAVGTFGCGLSTFQSGTE
ncbi:hypothetical protein [Rhodococcus marinonascens]|uniref:hypothetical protein n=1 Tax=Rhodococcus marinonascens TaxID=38311 RepID=UPI0011149414|nr:hypothetical protein [Rhodococcus marinonascens]